MHAINDAPGPLPEDVLNSRTRPRAPESALALAVIHKAAQDRDLGFFDGPGLELWLDLADCDLDPATIPPASGAGRIPRRPSRDTPGFQSSPQRRSVDCVGQFVGRSGQQVTNRFRFQRLT